MRGWVVLGTILASVLHNQNRAAIVRAAAAVTRHAYLHPPQSHSMGNGGRERGLTYVRKGVAVNPKVLRQYAVDCDRMAKECSDLFTTEALIELAVEFQRAAEEIESGSRAGRRRKQAPRSSAPQARGARIKPRATTRSGRRFSSGR